MLNMESQNKKKDAFQFRITVHAVLNRLCWNQRHSRVYAIDAFVYKINSININPIIIVVLWPNGRCACVFGPLSVINNKWYRTSFTHNGVSVGFISFHSHCPHTECDSHSHYDGHKHIAFFSIVFPTKINYETAPPASAAEWQCKF